MTQDAPLDQTAPIDADVLRKLVPGFRLDWSGLRNRFDDIAARLDKLTTYESRAAYLDEIARNFEDAVSDALSRRVPASGGEHPDDLAVDRFAAAMKEKLAKKRAEGRGGWERKDECTAEFLSELLRGHVEKGDPLDVGNLAMMLHQRGERIAASPIVTAPEGWRRAFLAYVEPEDAFTQLAIALCRADGNNPDATVSVDGGPMQRHWHYYAEEARTMLLATAPSIPEGKAEPVAWRWKSYLDMPGDEGYFVWSYSTVVDVGRESECEPLFAAPGGAP